MLQYFINKKKILLKNLLNLKIKVFIFKIYLGQKKIKLINI
jgi:hypothetical protein